MTRHRALPIFPAILPAVLLGVAMLAAGALPASAHLTAEAHQHGSFAAGFTHPFSGLDHVLAMLAVGLWAALKGGRALWVWPCAFVAVMAFGGVLGMAQMPLPMVEPGIAASVVALGLLAALAVDIPVAAGAAVIAVFALFHGHAHGTEAAGGVTGAQYLAGFALATAALHLAGIAAAMGLARRDMRVAVRGAGGAFAVAGLGLLAGVI